MGTFTFAPRRFTLLFPPLGGLGIPLGPALAKEHSVKIQVIQKANVRTKATDPCPYLIEMPPEAAKK